MANFGTFHKRIKLVSIYVHVIGVISDSEYFPRAGWRRLVERHLERQGRTVPLQLCERAGRGGRGRRIQRRQRRWGG